MSQSFQPFQSNFKECNVCCLYSNKFVLCVYCHDEACEKCHQTYILDQFQDKCMFCNKTWNFEFMQKNFKESWLSKTYKDKKKTLLFEKEKALLPITQQELKIEEEKERVAIKYRKTIERLNKYNQQLSLLNKKHADEDLLESLIAAINKMQDKIDILLVENSELENSSVENRTTVHPCSEEDCRGFLEKDFKCGICSTDHCRKCRCVKSNDHKCDPNTLETIKLMDKDTKPCPKCSVPIYKIEGCDQIWCVQCHTAFSWKTGNIENGPIHNPHYWQYLQQQGKDVDEINRLHGDTPVRDNPCMDINGVMIITGGTSFEACRILTNIMQYEIPKYTRVVDNKDLRVRYLQNDIDDKNLKAVLYRREKKHNFDTEMSQILSMIYDASKDILVGIFRETWSGRNESKNREKFSKLYKDRKSDILKICSYGLIEIENLSKRYGYEQSSGLKRVLNELIGYLS